MTISMRKEATRNITTTLGALSAIVLFVAIAVMIEPSTAAAVELHGAGSTFVAPLLKAWIDKFDMAQPVTSINY
ncbi:MAG: hypothetical protein ACREC9_16965, partial [Methylocella sp.]